MNATAAAAIADILPPVRQVSALGLAKIKQWEAPGGIAVLRSYRDSAGVWTIGFGHIDGVRAGMVCTPDQAERWLDEDLDEAEAAVAEFVTVALNDNQHAALVSFAFNVGTGAFERSTLVRMLNQGRYDLVPEQLMLWVNITVDERDPVTGVSKRVKKRLQGLINRRAYEIELWNTPIIATIHLVEDDRPDPVTTKPSATPGRAEPVKPVPPPTAPVANDVPDEPPAKTSVVSTSTGKAQITAGGAAVAAKAAGELATELQTQAGIVQQLAPYLEVAQWAFIVLFAGAIGFTLYERWQKLREGK